VTEPEWRRLNRANWDERVPVHINAPLHYHLSRLTEDPPRIDPIAAAALGPVEGLRILHLQCHFGMDTLNLARLGAQVVGVDFSPAAIDAARGLAEQLTLADRARFVLADVYEAAAALPEPAGFDRLFVSWGALCWLPDIAAWATVAAHFLGPGGYLAIADAHPFAYVFDDATAGPDGMPGWYAPYLSREPLHEDTPIDYADPDARLVNTRTVQFVHPLSDILNGLTGAGLRIENLTEHGSIVWRIFNCLMPCGAEGYSWPAKA
jgi:SAM-dependent methyltransferase